MTKALAVLFCLASILVACGAVAREPRIPEVPQESVQFETSFATDENPIHEGGKWLNGATDGIDWNNMETKGGSAIGHVIVGVTFADPIAILNPATTGPWTGTQKAQGTVFVHSGARDYYPEVELHLNTTIAPHNITGYEFDCQVLNVAFNPPDVCVIVRWNGPLADSQNSNTGFTYISPTVSTSFLDGDVMTAVNTGAATDNLRLFRNGKLILTATDHTYSNGTPGIGVNSSNPGKVNNYSDEGFLDFSGSNISPRP